MIYSPIAMLSAAAPLPAPDCPIAGAVCLAGNGESAESESMPIGLFGLAGCGRGP